MNYFSITCKWLQSRYYFSFKNSAVKKILKYMYFKFIQHYAISNCFLIYLHCTKNAQLFVCIKIEIGKVESCKRSISEWEKISWEYCRSIKRAQKLLNKIKILWGNWQELKWKVINFLSLESKLTSCPGAPFSPSLPGRPWKNQRKLIQEVNYNKANTTTATKYI